MRSERVEVVGLTRSSCTASGISEQVEMAYGVPENTGRSIIPSDSYS